MKKGKPKIKSITSKARPWRYPRKFTREQLSNRMWEAYSALLDSVFDVRDGRERKQVLIALRAYTKAERQDRYWRLYAKDAPGRKP